MSRWMPTLRASRLEEIGRQCGFRALVTSHGLYQKLGGSFHEECPMNAILFVDKAPEAKLPLPTFTSPMISRSSPARIRPFQSSTMILLTFFSPPAPPASPKGVMLSHLNALTFVNWGVQTFNVTADDRLSQPRSVQFRSFGLRYFCRG